MDLQKLVPRIVSDLFEERRLRAVAEKHAKDQLQRGATNLRLLCDKLRDMGYDTSTPTGKAVLARVLRIAAIQKMLGTEDDSMPPSEIGGDW